MPHHQAQKKSLRQDAKRYERNRSAKSRVRTLEKKLRATLAKGDVEGARAQFKDVQKALDHAKSRKLLKAETV
ncbi:MAG: 30S ribosomal protein S20, partial [Candidatus Omnitrophica bacterium]|nr:30S ribosomal protein S20 [Candidatus Omnitrophota bacterium]